MSKNAWGPNYPPKNDLPLPKLPTQKKAEKRRELARELFYWQTGGTDFSCYVFTLISKADTANKDRLRLAYPEYLAIYEEWMAAPDGDEFLKRAMR